MREIVAVIHALAFTGCTVAAEKYMREKAESSEVATLNAENNTQTAAAVREMNNLLRGTTHSKLEMMMWSRNLQQGLDFLPLRKIVHAVSFQDKNDASLLQIADACALIVRYFIEKKPNIGEFVNAFTNDDPQKLANSIEEDSLIGFAVIDF